MVDSLGVQLAKHASKLGQVSAAAQLGTCVSINQSTQLAVVNVGGGPVLIPCVGVMPTPQHKCWVVTLGRTMFCIGEQARPAIGTVSGSASAGLLPVTGEDGVSYSLAYNSAITSWSTGQKVLINWNRGGTVLCAVSADPYTHNDLLPDPPVITPPSSGAGSVGISPSWSGTQNSASGGNTGTSGFWTANVNSGNTELGAYGYNDVGSSIPDSATYGHCRIFLAEITGYGSAFTLGTHTLTSEAGTLVVANSITPTEASPGWWELGATIFNLLKTGAATGIATDHGGYHSFYPAGQNNSGALDIAWS